jgi:hypothetical protein
MTKQHHILNGDSLKEQFPDNISGEISITRECLVDGDVTGTTLDELFSARAKFIANSIDNFTRNDYYKKTVSEFERMQQIPENSEINLWFEDDLFCQVNFWFVIHLLKENRKNYCIYLVRPNKGNEYSFGMMSKPELAEAFKTRIKVTPAQFQKLGNFWRYYQGNETQKMIDLATKLKKSYSSLLPAIRAHTDRIPKNGQPGKPVQTLIQIIDELKTTDFMQVFRAFCKRDAIYGFGDVQVKRMLNELKLKE